MTDCLFCKIIAGEIPSKKVYEDGIPTLFTTLTHRPPRMCWW